MRHVLTSLLACLLSIVLVASAGADDLDWHKSLEKGKSAAKKSGRPMLVITAWPTGVCASCDTWRDRVPEDEAVQKAFERFELVEWHYDGLNGKVIDWTHESGNRHDDPSILAFVVRSDGVALSMSPDAYTPAAFARWLEKEADHFERHHFSTRIPFLRAKVTTEGEGEKAVASSEELDAAREEKKPVLVYVGRTARQRASKSEQSSARTCRKFEKGTLSAKSAAEGAKDWTVLRLDVGDDAHALLAKQLGVKKVPTLLAFAPGAEEPVDLGSKMSGQALAAKLKKLAADE